MPISIVIPVLNEEECIGPLLDEIAALRGKIPLADVVVVDDGSTDGTGQAVLARRDRLPEVRLVRHRERRGQSTATRTGIAAAKGDLIVTLDGDGQNDPADIPALFAVYEGISAVMPRTLVAGQRRKRQDNAVRRLSSRIANGVRARILDDGVRDTGCSLKLFRRADFLALPFFNHIHRFIPALMKATGVEIRLVDVGHRPRERGTSKYGLWDRLWVGIHDLVGVSWLIRRTPPRVETEELLMNGLEKFFDQEHVWLFIGFAGQLLFTARFLVQWIVSEKQRQSVVPVAFWYFSIGGGLLLFAYSLYRQDPVFILGQSMGIFIYARNLFLIHRASTEGEKSPSA